VAGVWGEEGGVAGDGAACLGGGRVGDGTAQGGCYDAVQRASGGATTRRGADGVPRTAGVRVAARRGAGGAAWGGRAGSAAARACGCTGPHRRCCDRRKYAPFSSAS
jgi:hypothetical protein